MTVTASSISESRWTVVLALLVVLGMLAAFHAVVNDAAQTGERRRQTNATHAAALTRCQSLAPTNNKSCRKDLDDAVLATR